MTSPDDRARQALWMWVDELQIEDGAIWSTWVEGMLLACERTAVLDPREIRDWRDVFDGTPLPPPPADSGAAAGHLESLIAPLVPMKRREDTASRQASEQFDDALGALHDAGVVDDEEHRVWKARALSVRVPWLDRKDVEQVVREDGLYAFSVPSLDADEEAEDARIAAQSERAVRRGEVLRVLTVTAIRRADGMALTSAVARSDSTEVHFHASGVADDGMHDSRRGPTPPELSDDVGTNYTPVYNHPVSTHWWGSRVDGQSETVSTGTWRYQPAMPPGATVLTAHLDDGTWELE